MSNYSNNFNMRISKKLEKASAFDMKSINNIPDIDIFVEPEINNAITNACKEVLMLSMNHPTFKYCEQGLIISIINEDINGNRLPIIHERLNGNYGHTIISKKARSIMKNRPVSDLVAIHNHPNSSPFSAADLEILSRTKSLYAVVAVGNISNVFVALDIHKQAASKIDKYLDNEVNKYISYIKKSGTEIDPRMIKRIKDKAVHNILDRAEEFSIEYYKFRRKSL